MEGSIDLEVFSGTPGPPDDSDVLVMISITDVRCKAGTSACGNSNAADGADYTGGVRAGATQRGTDHFNAVAAGGGTDPATVVDIPGLWMGPFTFACAETADTGVGSTCTANTSANAAVPGVIKDGKRLAVEFGQWRVEDGGPDGVVGTTPNTNFAVTGIFIP